MGRRRGDRGMRDPRPIKRSISFAIHRPDDPGQVLVVRRPPDDDELPGLWGLPAGSLRDDESWADAVRRSGREKLGVELEIGAELNHGTTPRDGYTLEMKLFEAVITDGEPRVPRSYPDVTQYADWRWARAAALIPAAGRGSLCCRLYLEREGG